MDHFLVQQQRLFMDEHITMASASCRKHLRGLVKVLRRQVTCLLFVLFLALLVEREVE